MPILPRDAEPHGEGADPASSPAEDDPTAIPDAKPGRTIGVDRAEFQRCLDALDALTAELDRRVARIEQMFARDYTTGK